VQKTKFHSFILASALLACSSSENGPSGGSGGTPGVGGTLGSGGVGPGPGGSPSASGGGQVGQVGGSGGAASGGGGASMGGAANIAGTTSTGGASGAGGSSNTGPATVQLGQVRQLIRGFGINNNWAPIGSDAERLFGEGPDALDLNILRIGMGPTGDPYNGASTYTDIDAAFSRGAQYIIGTLWSPRPTVRPTTASPTAGT
jgi:hypothetical protein